MIENNKTKVLLVVSTLNTGGAQKVAAELSNSLATRYDVEFLVNDTSKASFPYTGTIRTLGLPEQTDKNSLVYQAKVLVRRIKRIKRIKKSGEYKAVISFMDSANIANVLSGKGNCFCKTLITIHTNLSAAARDWKYRFFVIPAVRMLYERADVLLTVSKDIEYDLKNNLNYKFDNIRALYNGFDIKKIRQHSMQPLTEKETEQLNGFPVITTVGRLCYEKGQWHLIRAFSTVLDHYPNAKLVLVGDGEYKDRLKRIAMSLGLNERVQFVGFMENPYRIMRNSDVVVLSSYFEGLPSVLIEALAVGTPCVATDFKSGAREILAPELPIDAPLLDDIYKGQYGILTPLCKGGDLESGTSISREERLLSEAIITMLNNSKYYKQQAEKATAPFEINRITEKWISIIES